MSTKPSDTSTAAAPAVDIDRIQVERLDVPIVGTSPLIVHAFSEKAKRQMLDAQQGRKSPKAKRDPQADYESAFYRLDDDAYGFPVLAFKAATIGAARFFDKSVTMTALKQFLFFSGEPTKGGEILTRISGNPVMREDVVRIARGGTDLRYRPMFADWTAVLNVTFVKDSISRGSVLSLIEAGGLGVGVGEWRPEKSGAFGTYRLDDTRDVGVNR